MNIIQKKYWLFLLLFILLIAAALFLLRPKSSPTVSDKPMFVDQAAPIDFRRSESVPKESKAVPKKPLIDIAPYKNIVMTLKSDEAIPKKTLINVVPIKFTVKSYREISLRDGDALEPRVSPDGSRIVFVKRKESKNKIFIADLLDNKTLLLELGLDDYLNPSWNADGTKIVFSGMKSSIFEIYTYDLKNKKLSQVTNSSRRKKYWPRFSPYMFDENYRIAYVSEEKGRKDIWWVRESGEYDQPITLPAENIEEIKNTPYWKNAGFSNFITKGGDAPEWSPSGNILIYKTERHKYSALAYSYSGWWWETSIYVPSAKGILSWAPNQSSFLEYDFFGKKSYVYPRDTLNKKELLKGRVLTSSPSFFPDGKGLAYTYEKDGKSILAMEPYEDPLGDVVNLWMYPYSKSQKDRLLNNQLLFLSTKYEQIYSLYETESYERDPDQHMKPYLVTSDAVLETFYATFSALLDYVERVEFANALQEFASKGLKVAKEKKVSRDVENLFLVGVLLLKPDTLKNIPPEIQVVAESIQAASGSGSPLFGKRIEYNDFFIRGKYEKSKDLQPYFRVLKWFQTFKFNLEREQERAWVSEILEVVSTPEVYQSIERINLLIREIIGESRNYGPLTLKEWQGKGALPVIKPSLPWIQELRNIFTLLPSIYTLDAFIFDELITHTERSETVGSREHPRLLPVGMDIMAAFASGEARKILIEELKEGRFENYERRLNEVARKMKQFSQTVWDQNIYQTWLDTLNTLIKDPPDRSPEFTKTKGWKRKQLNTALGSWVNLRYETIGWVEQVAAESGEGGYERLNIGLPRGYVEPNPMFFKKLDDGFQRMCEKFRQVIKNPELNDAVVERINKYRKHLNALEVIARKEIDKEMLTDEEYGEIFYIGRTIEHFILVMNSLNTQQDEGGGLRNFDSIRKIVDVQVNPSGARLYEALGFVNEINVAVPYYGRKQIVKGPIYSYYEFVSPELLDSERWRRMDKPKLPVWIEGYYDGEPPPWPELPASPNPSPKE